MKTQLTPALVATVRAAMKGARLAKFDASVAILNESLGQGAWTPRGSVKAQSGFYQGLTQHYYHGHQHKAAWGLHMILQFGAPEYATDLTDANLQGAIKEVRRNNYKKGKLLPIKVSDEQIVAWVALCREKHEAFEALFVARPKPRITTIGLSPKVTKTLKDCNLDIDISTIEYPPTKKITIKDMKWDKELQKVVPVLTKDGKQAYKDVWVIDWPKDVVHGQSRFAGSGGCEACSKWIPSGRFCPIMARDNKSGKRVSMWLGLDCASNFFGVKDEGIMMEHQKLYETKGSGVRVRKE